MKAPPFVSRALIVMLLMFAALAASSCNDVSGVGVGIGTTARWGGSSSSPPIFVGGPSIR
jgi:predicted small secreted protein